MSWGSCSDALEFARTMEGDPSPHHLEANVRREHPYGWGEEVGV